MDKSIKGLVPRKLAQQKTVALFVDQEEKLNELTKKYEEELDIKIKLAKVVRQGLDVVLDQLEKHLEEELNNKTKK